MVNSMKYCVPVKILCYMFLIINGFIFPVSQFQLKAAQISPESSSSNNKISPIISIGVKSDTNKTLIHSASKSKDFDDKKHGESHGRKLTEMVTDDGEDDTASFLKCLNAYRQQNFTEAMKNFKDFIKTYPSGRYTERAWFLMAETCELLYSGTLSTNFTKMTTYYQDAVNRFPQSIYAPDALVSIADLYFKMNYFTEALGYYNYVLGQGKNFSKALHAMIQKAKILILKKQFRDARLLLEHIFASNPDKNRETQARLMMSKLLYETNAFQKSLDILSELKTENSQKFYQYPEIFMYTGNNYYELGDNSRARKNLFRFFNLSPDGEDRHLVLTRIGDTYRDEKKIKEAVKIYQLVHKLFPGTKGALISLIRLAEVQEQFSLKTADLIKMSSKEIYKKIINNPLDNETNNSFTHLAILKLAGLYIGEGAYGKSLDTLKKLSNGHLRGSLEKKRKYILQKSLELMIKKNMNKGKYNRIIDIYEREKNLFSTVNSPELFLSIAKAYKHLNFENVAIQIFRKIEPILQDKEKPPGLLLLLSKSLFENQKFKTALTTLNLLLDNDLSGKYSGLAFQVKGEIYLAQKKNDQAVKMFYSALKYPIPECGRVKLLISLAGALSRPGFKQKALKAVREADSLKKKCNTAHGYIYEETGDIFLDLGYPKEAAANFKQAVSMAKKPANKIPVKVKLAQSYWRSNKEKECVELYMQIAALNRPFWSNLAKERIEKINFDREINKQVN